MVRIARSTEHVIQKRRQQFHPLLCKLLRLKWPARPRWQAQWVSWLMFGGIGVGRRRRMRLDLVVQPLKVREASPYFPFGVRSIHNDLVVKGWMMGMASDRTTGGGAVLVLPGHLVESLVAINAHRVEGILKTRRPLVLGKVQELRLGRLGGHALYREFSGE